MPVLLEGTCHCRAVKYTVESNTPVPFQICQCSICRKVGGYMGSSNIMGNYDTFKIIRGEENIKVYVAAVEFDKDDKPKTIGNSQRSFCTNCSSMLWNYHEEWPQWIYPFTSTIDSPNPLPGVPGDKPVMSIMRGSCPDYVPHIEGAEAFDKYGNGGGIEEWHKATGAWVD